MAASIDLDLLAVAKLVAEAKQQCLLAELRTRAGRAIERTLHRYDNIHRLVEKDWAINAISRRLSLDRKTARSGRSARS